MIKILDSKEERGYVISAKSGDAEAFACLYDTYIKQIYEFIFYKTMHQETAEDISSDVFLKAWKKIDQFKSGEFVAWLYTIARNAVIDYYRQNKDIKDVDDFWDLSDDQDILLETDKLIMIEKLKKIMSSFNNNDREILIMRFWQDLSFAEIAQLLDKEQGAVKMSCMRAIKKLQIKMPLALFIILPIFINIWKKIN